MIELIDQSALNKADQSQTPVLQYRCSDCKQIIEATSRAQADLHAKVCPARANARPDVMQLAADMTAMRQEMIVLRAENAQLRGQAPQLASAPPAPALPKKRGRKPKAEAPAGA